MHTHDIINIQKHPEKWWSVPLENPLGSLTTHLRRQLRPPCLLGTGQCELVGDGYAPRTLVAPLLTCFSLNPMFGSLSARYSWLLVLSSGYIINQIIWSIIQKNLVVVWHGLVVSCSVCDVPCRDWRRQGPVVGLGGNDLHTMCVRLTIMSNIHIKSEKKHWMTQKRHPWGCTSPMHHAIWDGMCLESVS